MARCDEMELPIGQDIREVSLGQLREVGHRPQPAVRSMPGPAVEEPPGH
jgi:hypothetical protein